MTERRKPTRDGLEILRRRFDYRHPERAAALEQERITAAIARQAYDLREEAGLARHQMARKIGTTSREILRLEENDFEGDALLMLQRIAGALGCRVEVRVLPRSVRKKPA